MIIFAIYCQSSTKSMTNLMSNIKHRILFFCANSYGSIIL